MRSLSTQQLAWSVRQRLDLGGQLAAFGANTNSFIVDPEMLTLLNSSMAYVWDFLVQKFPANYMWGYDGNASGAGYFFPIEQGVYQYYLPFDFYKEKGVDLSLDASLQNWSTMRPYTERDRNLFSYPLQTVLAYAGWQNMRWQIQGNKINFLPKQGPLPGTVRLLYAPAAPILCATLPTQYQANATIAQFQMVYVSIALETGKYVSQVYMALNSGTNGSVGSGSIGTGNSAVTYQSINTTNLAVPIVVNHTTSSGSLTVTTSVGASQVTITVSLGSGSPTASTVAAAVNANATASSYVTATAGGSGASVAVSGTVTLSPWSVPGTIQDGGVLWAYQGPLSLFATTVDGINGYEDLLILDAAIKAGIKEETDVSAMMAQKQEWVDRIEYAAANRNSGDPMVISGGFGQTEGGTNYGGGFGPWSGGGW